MDTASYTDVDSYSITLDSAEDIQTMKLAECPCGEGKVELEFFAGCVTHHYNLKQLKRAASLMKFNGFKISSTLSILINEKTIHFTESYVCLWVEMMERIKAMKDGKHDEFKEWPLAQTELAIILKD